MREQSEKNLSAPTPVLNRSVLMENILKTMEHIAVSDLGVRIVGENGTGKEWLARLIHKLSARAGAHFAHLDCSAIPHYCLEEEIFGREGIVQSGIDIRPGILETANGGTVYFDRIAALPVHLKIKIARALERQHFRRVGGYGEVAVNVRVITGVNKQPDEFIRSSARDITDRISPICINLPPLRERRDDIPFLIGHFIQDARRDDSRRCQGITAEALQACLAHDWPGNIHELRSAIEYAALMSGEALITDRHLPDYLRPKSSPAGNLLSEAVEA